MNITLGPYDGVKLYHGLVMKYLFGGNKFYSRFLFLICWRSTFASLINFNIYFNTEH